jgi:hypothetical protein
VSGENIRHIAVNYWVTPSYHQAAGHGLILGSKAPLAWPHERAKEAYEQAHNTIKIFTAIKAARIIVKLYLFIRLSYASTRLISPPITGVRHIVPTSPLFSRKALTRPARSGDSDKEFSEKQIYRNHGDTRNLG